MFVRRIFGSGRRGRLRLWRADRTQGEIHFPLTPGAESYTLGGRVGSVFKDNTPSLFLHDPNSDGLRSDAKESHLNHLQYRLFEHETFDRLSLRSQKSPVRGGATSTHWPYSRASTGKESTFYSPVCPEEPPDVPTLHVTDRDPWRSWWKQRE